MDSLKELNINELFSGSDKYMIPIYQRNYAWKEPQVVQLINDINDYALQENTKPYYIGTLVVFRREISGDIFFETIDGQQRLTTLFILLSYLRSEKGYKGKFKENLKFESRDNSSKALNNIYKHGGNTTDSGELNVDILEAYNDIKKAINKIDDFDHFQDYLLNKVRVLRVSVPKDTDLNHYFEIMNNRGEQLEKHEILKAKMLSVLKDNKTDMYVFNLIWEACSNMEKYVQYGFDTEQRKELFGKKWSKLQAAEFSEVAEIVKKFRSDDTNNKSTDESTVEEIIVNSTISKPHDIAKNTTDKFTSPINFPNFLLQVLKVQTGENIPLDDKRLLDTFDKYLGSEKNEGFIRDFGFNLLKLKYLSDKYIIKREFLNGDDDWSLKELRLSSNNKSGYYKNTYKDESENRQILMLLALFHVSAPTLIYKHWFSAALNYVFKNPEKRSQAKCYIEYLERLAKSYLYNRYLSNDPLDYHVIIFENKAEKKDSDVNKDQMNKGTGVENFIFNYLDYLLWKRDKSKYSKFEFAFRSSVEHYYPQNPMENIEPLVDETLNSFGNLCLVTRSENSRLSNFTPKAKKEFYEKQVNNSIKQQKMMNAGDWNSETIKEHEEEMKAILGF